MIKFILILASTLSLLSTSLAQSTNREGLLNKLHHEQEDTSRMIIFTQLGDHYKSNNIDSALLYYGKALTIAKEFKRSTDQGDIISKIGQSYFYSGDYQKAIDTLNFALRIFEQTKYSKGKASIRNNIGVIYYNLGEYEKAMSYWEPLLELYSELSDSSGLATIYVNFGVIHYSRANYNKALENFLKALDIREKTGNKSGIASINAKLALIYKNQNQYKQALSHNKRALALYNELGDELGTAKILNNIANNYTSLDSIEKSINTHLRSLQISKKINNKRLIATNLNNLSTYYINNGNYERALQYLAEAYQINQELGRQNEIANTLHNYGHLYDLIGENEKALQYFKQAAAVANEIGVPQKIQLYYSRIAQLFGELGNYQKAWHYQKEAAIIKDSLFQKERIKQIEKLKAQYENEKQEKEIAILKKNKKLQEAELQKSTLIRSFLIVFIGLTLLFALVYFFRYKKTVVLTNKLKESNDKIASKNQEIAQKSDNLREINQLLVHKNKQIQKQSEHLKQVNEMKVRMFSIIGHDLKGPAATLKNSFELLLSKEYDKEKIRRFHELMYENITSLYNLLENLLVWAKSQRNEVAFQPKKEDMKKIIQNNVGLLSNIAKQKDIDIKTDFSDNLIAEADPNMISTVVRNLISNAIKFTPNKGQIFILCNSANGTVHFSVRDTGIGIKKENLDKIFNPDEFFSTPGTNKEKGSGLGLNICKKFVEMHQGEISVTSDYQKGTIFHISIPVEQNNT